MVTLARADDSLFKGAVVVVLVGVPGDIDSETEFEAETKQLLTQLNTAESRPKHLYLLSNLTIDFDKPAYAFDQLSNKREVFLGLPDRLKSETAPLVFLAFGHGGSQGDLTVFHVPGPRLQPQDFGAVAKQLGAPATWLLFFRGSGLFAQQVHFVDKQTVLATESDDKTFQEDPISLNIFLDSMRELTSLKVLSQAWANKTDSWYRERHLARVEEPALWSPGTDPRKLISSEVAVDNSPSPSPSLPPSVSPSPSAVAASAQPAPPDWSPPASVDAKSYPGIAAIVLSRKESYVIGDQNNLSLDREDYIQILQPNGKRFGDFDITYSPPDEDLRFVSCEVCNAQGTVEQLNPDNIFDANSNNDPGAPGVPKHKIFSMPHVQAGVVLHVHYIRSWAQFPLPHIFQEAALSDEIPIQKLQIDVSLPKKMNLHWKLLHGTSTEPLVTDRQYGQNYEWTFHDLQPVPNEPLSPRENEPSLALTTFADWHDFLAWYVPCLRNSDVASPEMTAAAQDLVKGAKTDREKIAAVTRYVTGLRYVSVPLGINSWRPHAAVNVWHNRFGDCKDKANLLNTLLGTLGYKTNLVLVPRFSQAYEALPGFAFNHAISVVHLPNESLWIDSTDDVCTFGLLPPGDPGRNVLVVKSETPGLTELPEPTLSDHQFEIATSVKLDDHDSRAAMVKMEVKTKGFADYALRSALNARKGSIGVLDSLFQPVSGRFEPSQEESSSTDDLSAPATCMTSGTWRGLISAVPASKTKLMFLPAWVPSQWDLAALPRHNDLFLNEGYPMSIEQNFTIDLSPDARGVEVPANAGRKGPALSWDLEWSKVSDQKITAKLTISLEKSTLDSAGVADFQLSYNLLEDALRDGLAY